MKTCDACNAKIAAKVTVTMNLSSTQFVDGAVRVNACQFDLCQSCTRQFALTMRSFPDVVALAAAFERARESGTPEASA